MPNSTQIEKFLNTHRDRSAKIITVLAKRAKFKAAIETDIGQELMIDALSSMEEILEKIIMETATPKEKADFRALRMIMTKWQDKIAAYNKAVFKVENNTTKEI